jgi:hypothetical protein
MPKEAIEKFIQVINNSNTLLTECRVIMMHSKDASPFAVMGMRNGFYFTEAEVRAYFEEILSASPPGALHTKKPGETVNRACALAIIGKSAKLEQAIQFCKGIGVVPGWTGWRY